MRDKFLPFCLPQIGDEEIAEVVDSLRSGWITAGPKTLLFEDQFRQYTGSQFAIALSSCTAALHLALAALRIGPGDEVIVPTFTFCATANVVVHLGATPVLCDVDRNGLLTVESIRPRLSPRTRAILPVHFAGQSCDLATIRKFANEHGLHVVEDAAHAAGARYRGLPIGAEGEAVAFSFYATKNMTTGEGGMLCCSDPGLADTIRRLALHGMSRDAWKRYSQAGSWYYEVLAPGFKANMTDIQAALGIHQLRKLESFITRREAIAGLYDAALGSLSEIDLPPRLPERRHAFHLYAIRICTDLLTIDRNQFIEELRERGVGSSVHFIPLHRHPYYRDSLGLSPEQFPEAERIYQGSVSLPLYPKMTNADVEHVVTAVAETVRRYRRPAFSMRFSDNEQFRLDRSTQ